MLVLLPAAVPLEATKLTAAAPRGVSGSAEVPNSLENPPEDIPAPHEECFRSHVLVDTLRLINVPGSHSPSPNDPPNVFGTLPSGVTTFPGPADFHPYQSQQCGILRSLLLSQGQTLCCPTGTVNKFATHRTQPNYFWRLKGALRRHHSRQPLGPLFVSSRSTCCTTRPFCYYNA